MKMRRAHSFTTPNKVSVTELIMALLSDTRVWSDFIYTLFSQLTLHPIGVVVLNKQAYGDSVGFMTVLKSGGILSFLKGANYHFTMIVPQAVIGWTFQKCLSPYKKMGIDTFLISHLATTVIMYPFYLKQARNMILDFTVVNKEESAASTSKTELIVLPKAQIYSKSLVTSIVDWWNNGSVMDYLYGSVRSLSFSGLSLRLTELVLHHILGGYVHKGIEKLEFLKSLSPLMRSLTSSVLHTSLTYLVTYPIETLYRRHYVKSIDYTPTNFEKKSLMQTAREIRDGGYRQFYSGYLLTCFKMSAFPIIVTLAKYYGRLYKNN